MVNNNTTTITNFGIVNVSPSTNRAGFGYLSPFTNAMVQRLFYQATNGNLVTAAHTGITGDPAWKVDSAPIATNLPLGTVVSAFWSGSPTRVFFQVLLLSFSPQADEYRLILKTAGNPCGSLRRREGNCKPALHLGVPQLSSLRLER